MLWDVDIEECFSFSLLGCDMRGWGETHDSDNLKYIFMKCNIVLIKTNACQKI